LQKMRNSMTRESKNAVVDIQGIHVDGFNR